MIFGDLLIAARRLYPESNKEVLPVATVDPDIPVVDIMTMDTALSLQRQGPIVIGTMFSVFAIVALLLSAVALYAVTSHSVAQRTPEIGIRMALGAQSRQVQWMFFSKLLLYLGVGFAIGFAGSIGVGWLMRSVLYGVGPFDPATLAATAIVLTLVAIAACYWPARHATRISPLIALRYE